MPVLGLTKMGSLFLLLVVLTFLAIPETRAIPSSPMDPFEFLTAFGYITDDGNADGPVGQIIESKYEEALKKYQDFMGLNVTGVYDEATKKEMEIPRCGVPDFGDKATGLDDNRRKKRYVLQGSSWPISQLTYHITGYGNQRLLSVDDIDQAVNQAFQTWANQTNLQFTQVPEDEEADLEIFFARRSHGGNNTQDPSFDGPGGTLAHAFFPRYGGDAHFDDDETFTLEPSPSSSSRFNFLQVAIHEFGHTLGLRHSGTRGAIMWAAYQRYRDNNELHRDDIFGIRALYASDRCPPSPEGQNSNVTVTGNGYNETASYVCDFGYIPVSGQHELQCINGRYLFRNALICGPKPCPSPPAGVNAVVIVYNRSYGKRASYSCKTGFTRESGESYIECRNGNYTSSNALICAEARPCPSPPTGFNVEMRVYNRTYGQAIYYSCKFGFARESGSSYITCRNGYFSSLNPLICVPRPCPRAPYGSNSIASVNGTGQTQTATYACVPNYTPSGGRTQLQCVNGTYTSTYALRCLPKPCPSPPQGLNSRVETRRITLGTQADYTCETGFVSESGLSSIPCVNGNYTSTNALVCVQRIPCHMPPPKGQNSWVTVYNTSYGQMAAYSCEPGFVRDSGSTTILCDQGNYTHTDALNCDLPPCPSPPRGSKSVASVNGTRFHQTVSYNCSNGLVPVGGEEVLQCVNGTFTSTDALRCGCGQALNGTGTFTSPNYPSNYGNNEYCNWTLSASAGRYVCITFDAFNLESNSLCRYDRVTVYSTSGFQIGKYCGSVNPGTIATGRSTVTVRFTTDSVSTRSGFSARFTSCDRLPSSATTTTTSSPSSCGRSLFGSGTFYSPNYPFNYNNNVRCTWTLRSSGSKYVCITFNAFSLESHTTCNNDNVVVSSTSGIYAKYCGTLNPGMIATGSSTVTVRFTTNFISTRSGFTARFTSCDHLFPSTTTTTTPTAITTSSPFVPQSCPSPPRGRDSVVSVNGTGSRQTAMYRCRTSYKPSSGSAQLECINGTYASTSALNCVPDCGNPPRGRNSIATEVPASQGVRYECKPGFKSESGREFIQCVNGNYLYTNPLVCVPLECPIPPRGRNSILMWDEANGAAFYRCFPGFEEYFGSRTLSCANREYTPRYTPNTPLHCSSTATPPTKLPWSNLAWNPCLQSAVDAATTTADGRTYFFRGQYYLEVKYDTNLLRIMVESSPRLISLDWPGLESHLDAALTYGETTYFFKGSYVWMFKNKAVIQSKGSSSVVFPSLPSNLDAAYQLPEVEHVHFVKGDQVYTAKYNYVTHRFFTDQSVQSPTSTNSISQINAAFKWLNNQTYFFMGSDYYRFDHRTVEFGSDYPVNTGNGWFNCVDGLLSSKRISMGPDLNGGRPSDDNNVALAKQAQLVQSKESNGSTMSALVSVQLCAITWIIQHII